MRSEPATFSTAALAAPLFVVLWSTGFIGAKLGLPYAEPLTFLSVRFAIASAALALWCVASSSEWPGWRMSAHLAVVGVLLHAVYLGGVFAAISMGIEAGVSALIVSMQPILTALLARWALGERLNRIQWGGIALGFAGVVLVIAEKIEPGAGAGSPLGLGLCIGALVAIAVATLYQKRFCGGAPMRAGSAIQFFAATLAIAPLALILETNRIVWSGEFVFALGWLVIVLSIGAVGLLHALIRRDAASRVASLFFLVPPVTALIAWALFGEVFGMLALAGLVLATLGVALVMRGGTK